MRKSYATERRQPILLIAALAALAVLSAVMIVGTVIINSEHRTQKAALENAYSRAFYTACDCVNNLEVNLSKLMVAPAGVESTELIHEVGVQAELAESALSELPLDYNNIVKTGKYFNQVSDWCTSYVNVILRGGDTEGFTRQAETLYIAARNINANLNELAEQLKGKRISDCVGDKRLMTLDLNFTFEDMENNSIEYPELIYDGPFSDEKKQNRHGHDTAEITAEQALNKATQAFKLTEAHVVGRSEGDFGTFEIEGKVDGRDAYVAVGLNGTVVSFNTFKSVGAVKLSREAAIAAAEVGAQKLGFENMTAVWYNAENGVAFVNLAPYDGGVIYYTDLVKVKIELGGGEVIGLEAMSYCDGEHDRSYSPTITENTARALVSDKLTISEVRLAVIPDGEDERLCYEVHGMLKGLDYFVYIDAETGETAEIKRVVDSEQGETVM